MRRFIAGCVLGLVAGMAGAAIAGTNPSEVASAPPTTEVSSTTSSTVVVTTSTTLPSPPPPPAPSIWNENYVDPCGRGMNYPEGWYTEPVPQATPGDLQPDPKRCPAEYREWLIRQGASGPQVSHCISEDQDGYFWTSGDPNYTRSVYDGKRWSCLGVTPAQWEHMQG